MDTDRQAANQATEAQDAPQDGLFDAFCQPRTIPSRWDLAGMSGAVHADGKRRPPGAPFQCPPNPADQAEEASDEADWHIDCLNPFPEPRAYPVHWNLI